jgi:hypothetical protein
LYFGVWSDEITLKACMPLHIKSNSIIWDKGANH